MKLGLDLPAAVFTGLRPVFGFERATGRCGGGGSRKRPKRDRAFAWGPKRAPKTRMTSGHGDVRSRPPLPANRGGICPLGKEKQTDVVSSPGSREHQRRLPPLVASVDLCTPPHVKEDRRRRALDK